MLSRLDSFLRALVLPGLYLGNFIDAKDLDQLGRNKITHIISIHESPQPLLQDITYLRIPVADTPEVPIKKHFKECINFIHCCRLNGGNCLVHCFAAPPAAGGALRREPLPRRGGAARAASAVQALPTGLRDLDRLRRAALRRLRGNPAAPGAALAPGSSPAAAAAGARQADFLLSPAVSVPQGRQVRMQSRRGSPLPPDWLPSGAVCAFHAPQDGPRSGGSPEAA
ncbi:uncharacterized protein DUSP15 isoform X8 [Callithrix jacchus]|uniref:dual specificity protein phosphatase 15 isoform X9 n=1 Tax=Callithrix jacchus TaxID=9483 RepID=UPI0023DD3B53|nr:dual specificity protein phosphatase 15 isoform X9 [Callithrix jacchus]